MFRPITALLSLFLSVSMSNVQGRELRFAPLPLENKNVIHEQYQGLVSYLSKKSGYRLKMRFYKDYAKIIEAFSNDQIDIAYLGPLPYVILKKQFSAQEPIVCFRDTQGEASYTCSLVVFGDSGLTLDKLKGVQIGLTQPYSTCGYLAVSQMLDEAGLSIENDDNTAHYAGSHSQAALGGIRGEYDVAGIKTAISKRYAHLGLQTIAESQPYPGFALIANTNTMSREEITTLRNILLDLDPAHSISDRELTERWGSQFRNGAVTPEHCNYETVFDALNRLPWPIPGTGQ
ncbi:MAG: PhnD/SsuA/transferrin family substrate-binding protein [Candidatus Thiodiazotropha sp.]